MQGQFALRAKLQYTFLPARKPHSCIAPFSENNLSAGRSPPLLGAIGRAPGLRAAHPTLPARPSLLPTGEHSRALPAIGGSRSGGSRRRAGRRRLSPDVAEPRRAQAAPRGPEQRPRAARDAQRQAPGRAPPGCPLPLLSARAVEERTGANPKSWAPASPAPGVCPLRSGGWHLPGELLPGTGTQPRKARRGQAGGTASFFPFLF